VTKQDMQLPSCATILVQGWGVDGDRCDGDVDRWYGDEVESDGYGVDI